jgi:hypothetical protein
MPVSESEKSFRNPQSVEYDGPFSVEVEPGAKRVEPASATRTDNVVQVANGRVRQVMGGIQLYGLPDKQDPFYFGYESIVCIRKSDGTLLWLNNRYR